MAEHIEAARVPVFLLDDLRTQVIELDALLVSSPRRDDAMTDGWSER